MPRKRPFKASLDQVRIARTGDTAVIEYADPNVWTTHFQLGPEVAQMSDQEILERFNSTIEAREHLAAQYEHRAVEIPLGKPQIQYSERSFQWSPRGDVLRCQIDDGGPDGEPIIHIDDQELSWRDFGQLLLTHAGWGMRIIFVPDDELHVQPPIEVRESR